MEDVARPDGLDDLDLAGDEVEPPEEAVLGDRVVGAAREDALVGRLAAQIDGVHLAVGRDERGDLEGRVRRDQADARHRIAGGLHAIGRHLGARRVREDLLDGRIAQRGREVVAHGRQIAAALERHGVERQREQQQRVTRGPWRTPARGPEPEREPEEQHRVGRREEQRGGLAEGQREGHDQDQRDEQAPGEAHGATDERDGGGRRRQSERGDAVGPGVDAHDAGQREPLYGEEDEAGASEQAGDDPAPETGGQRPAHEPGDAQHGRARDPELLGGPAELEDHHHQDVHDRGQR